MRVVELRAVRGHALVAGVPLSAEVPGGRTWGLPPDLVTDLQEWARAAATPRAEPTDAVAAGGHGSGASGGYGPGSGRRGAVPAPPPADELAALDGPSISRRGRHLAARLSGVLGAPVDYWDPVTGHRIPLRAVTRTPHPPPVALPPRGSAAPAGEPTPWGTGLTLSALTAGLVLLANLALAAPMITRLGALGLLIDLVVAAGLVPALWLNRRARTWRWAVYGTLAGMVLALPFLIAQAVSG